MPRCVVFFFGSITYFSWVGYTPQALLLVLGSNHEKHVFIMRPQRQSRNPHFFWTCTLVKVETSLSKFRWLRIPPRCGKQVKKKSVCHGFFKGGLQPQEKPLASCCREQKCAATHMKKITTPTNSSPPRIRLTHSEQVKQPPPPSRISLRRAERHHPQRRREHGIPDRRGNVMFPFGVGPKGRGRGRVSKW